MTRGFSTVQAAVDAIGRGEVIIVVDAEDRENEGDFVCAAEKATTATVNFILSGRGQFCVPILPEVCERLRLTPVVDTNTAPLRTGEMAAEATVKLLAGAAVPKQIKVPVKVITREDVK